MFNRFSSTRSRAPRARQRSRPLAVERLEDRCLMSVDMVLRWNEVALQAAVVDHGLDAPGIQFGPTRTGRAFAIEATAVFDAVNSIDPQYHPYLIQLPAPHGASIDAAVAEAAHETLVALYPYQHATFDAELVSSLQGIPLIPAVEGVAVGYIVAHYILAVRTNDGSQIDAPGHQPPYTYGQLPGQWRADPLHPDATPLTPDWGSVTPFVVQSATQFGAPPPPSITSQAYADAYNEVKAIGGDAINTSTIRNDNQTNIGFYWGYDVSPGLCAPVRFYNQITDEVAQQMGNTELQNARLLALLNLALADAGITSWNDKYRYAYWRPVTAIRENDPGSPSSPTGLGSGNPSLVGQGDTGWTPLGAPADNGSGTNFTPPFPSYTSGHATFGGATFKMLEDYYRTDAIPGGLRVVSDEFNTITVDQFGNPRPLLPRTYNYFSQMAGENAQSRIYLGIHWHFDATEGIRSGDEIADYVFTHALLPRQGPAPAALPSADPEVQIQLSIQLEDAAANGGIGGGGSGGAAAPQAIPLVGSSGSAAPSAGDTTPPPQGSAPTVSTTIATQATVVHDAAALVGALIQQGAKRVHAQDVDAALNGADLVWSL
jgi:hypothetical protein